MDGRCIAGATTIYNSFAHGTKGSAILSNGGDCGAPSSTYKGQNPERRQRTWESQIPPGQGDPYTNEWNDLVDAIRNNKPYSELEYGVKASLVSSLGRVAAHTARETTLEELLNSKHEYAPGVDKLTMDSPAPLQAGADGKYPIPYPGVVVNREY